MIAYDPHKADLQWLLLRDFEGDLGVRSSMAAQLEVAARGGVHLTGTPYREVEERAIEAATKLKRLDRRWRALPEEHQRTLRAYYAITQRILPEWAGLGALVLSRPLSHAEHLKSKSTRHLVAWLARLPVRASEAATYARIREDAQTALESARTAWHATGGRRG